MRFISTRHNSSFLFITSYQITKPRNFQPRKNNDYTVDIYIKLAMHNLIKLNLV